MLEALDCRLAPAAHTWSGAAGVSRPEWSNPLNWSSGGAPQANETTVALTFPAVTNTNGTNDVPNLLINTITFSGGGYTISGNPLALSDVAFVASNAGVNTINVDVHLATGGGPLFSIAQGSMLVIGGSVSGNAGLEQLGGTLVLARANSYTGTTLVDSNSALTIRNDVGLGSGPVDNHGILNLDGANVGQKPLTLNDGSFLQALSASTSWAGPITVSGDQVTFQAPIGTQLTVSGVIRDSQTSPGARLDIGGGGKVVFQAANTFSGPVLVDDTLLDIQNAAALGVGGPVPFGMRGPDTTVIQGGAVEVEGGITVATEQLTLQEQGGIRIVGGANVWAGRVVLKDIPGQSPFQAVSVDPGTQLTISGGVDGDSGAVLNKFGAGTLVITGGNPFPGATTIDAGTVLVDGSLANSPVTVNSGSTLGGRGTVGTVTVNNGGILSPGDSPGTLHSGSATFTAGALFRVELNGPAAGTGYDQLDVTGTVTLNGATLAVGPGFTPQPGQQFMIIRNDGTDQVSGTFNGLAEGTRFPVFFGLQRQFYFITYRGGDGNDVVLTYDNTATMVSDLQVTPAAVDEGGTVTLTGRLTDPDERDRLTLVVDWGDGSVLQTFNNIGREPFHLTHIYRDNPPGSPVGSYTIHVAWRDQHGDGNSRDLPVTVRNVAPTVDAVGNAVLHAGGVLDRIGSFRDPGVRDTWTATVDYGDGSGTQPLSLLPNHHFVLHHRYETAGTFTVTVTVRDDDGGVGSAGFRVTVQSRPGDDDDPSADQDDVLDTLFALLAENGDNHQEHSHHP
jgi:autotransporter-associated beta strand protein